MIELTAQRGVASHRSVKIVGIGGAGANALDRMALDGVNPAHLIAANTDAQALVASVAGEKIQLGRMATRGLGSGGDPDLGRAASEEASGEVRSALNGIDTVFLLAGLGGGTGSGAVPFIAETARDSGALVIAIVTLPFAFEGKRRVGQAMEALAALQNAADAVICFENDRMADAVSPKAGIAQAFSAADQTISQSVQAIASLLGRNGLVRLGFDELQTALRTVNARCLFGHGEAEGDNRPYDALARAFKNPLMDKGRLLRECETVLVQVSGGPDMTLNEVQLLMEELNRHLDSRTRILFGTAVDPALAGRLTVTVLSSLAADEAVAPAPVVLEPAVSELRIYTPEPAAVVEPEPAPVEEEEIVAVVEPEFEIDVVLSEPEPEGEPESVAAMEEEISLPVEAAEEEAAALPEPVEATPPLRQSVAAQTSFFGEEPVEKTPEPGEVPPAAPVPAARVTRLVPGRTLRPSAPPKAEPAPAPEPLPEPKPASKSEPERSLPAPSPAAPLPPAAPAPPKMPMQETLQFEPVTRGRFEKSEPTIVDGQDLDVPTFLRRNIRIRP